MDIIDDIQDLRKELAQEKSRCAGYRAMLKAREL